MCQYFYVRSLAGVVDLVAAPAGTWYVLYERDMKFSKTRETHPWVLALEWSPRTVFGHVCVRTSQRCDDGIHHSPHQSGHESMCYLDKDGTVLPSTYRQILREARHAGWRSCNEDASSELIDELLRQVPPES